MIKDRVLVIDDERAFRILISTTLSARGYEVKAAANGKEAEAMITSHSPDLIILDLGLPDMDGMDILKKFRAWSKTPVIIVSARTSEDENWRHGSGPPCGTRERIRKTTRSRSWGNSLRGTLL